MNITKHFTLQEFASKDGSLMPDEVEVNIILLAEQLQIIRDHFNQPITVTSGYRSLSHNARIGGAKNSFHTKGMAADIKVRKYAPKVVAGQLAMLIDAGKLKEGCIGIYDTWVHYDIRGTRVRYDKRKIK